MKYLAILRGINVGGHRKILMADLKVLFTTLGFENISTYIQSGNVFFETNKERKDIENSIVKGIEDTFGFKVPVIIIQVEELKAIKSKNPYVENNGVEKLHVTFLNEKPSKEIVDEINGMDFTPDKFSVIERLVFLNIEGKYHKSKLSNNFFEKKLGVVATTRNWKTINKLIELSE